MKVSYRLQSLIPARRRAVALIIVLSMLVLMSALLVAFMSSVSTERSSAASANSGFEALQANNTAVNLAISQIRQATSQPQGASWASQPGAIWAFDKPGKEKIYKLYSSDVMQQNIDKYHPENEDENGIDLGKDNGVVDGKGFVDLNAPVFTPIPSASDSKGSNIKYDVHYPIADPRAGLDYKGEAAAPGRGVVDGFYASKLENSEGKMDKRGKPIRLLPMPVKWLYQLKDGTIEAADLKGIIQHASKENPPISRMAFWTDDESAKININTASEGTFWDTPMAGTIQESGMVSDVFDLQTKDLRLTLNLSAAQPARYEYQRFTGHPATTCLSPVMRWLFDENYDTSNSKTETKNSIDGDFKFKEAIYKLSPRYVGGLSTSQVASQNIAEDRNANGDFIDKRIRKRDRLFVNLDEYFFRPDRTPLSSDGLSKVFVKPGNEISAGIPSFTADKLETLRFFLTANSRASELNLFGKPRMCIWPVSDNDSIDPRLSKRTAFDDLIAFCSTFPTPANSTDDKKQYFFQRADTGSLSSNMEVAGGSRNLKLYEYISYLATKDTPGTGAKFSDKYLNADGSNDTDQILTEMFDYIRCTNLVDTGGKSDPDTGALYPQNPYTAFYFKDPLRPSTSAAVPGSGQVIPLDIPRSNGVINTHGFGRFPTVSEVTMLYYYDNTDTVNPSDVLIPGMTPIRCVLILEMVTPSAGYPALAETYAVEIAEATAQSANTTVFQEDAFSYADFVTGDPVKLDIAPFTAKTTNIVTCGAALAPRGRFFTGARGFANQFLVPVTTAGKPKVFSKISTPGTPPDLNYPFYSKRINVPSGKTLTISPGSFLIDIKPVTIANNTPTYGERVQRLVVHFNGQKISVLPALPTTPTSPYNNVGKVFQARLSLGDLNQPGSWIASSDVSRSMQAAGDKTRGDTRLIAASKFVPKEYFEEVKPIGNHGHTLHTAWGNRYEGASLAGSLSINAGAVNGSESVNPAYLQTKCPDTPLSNTVDSGVRNKYEEFGDFDRGMSKWTDGAFIGKPDEGNVRFETDSVDARLPYFKGGNGYKEVDREFFSPNRLVSSAICFGSLPTGVKAVRPWETLKFRPMTGLDTYRYNKAPSDHYWLDFFQMPVVEPYAISEPMSCAGRINLNCRIAPFGYLPDKSNSGKPDPHDYPHYYLERSTGLHGLLKSLYLLTVPNKVDRGGHIEAPTGVSTIFRHKVDRYRTIDLAIHDFLDKNTFFRSATQICDIDLFPLFRSNEENTPDIQAEPDLTKINLRTQFWEGKDPNNSYTMTGDNMRERPYTYIYPRLTTKSNVYTVHVWSQAITKNSSGNAEHWKKFDEDRDRIVGEYRGSTTIERFLDPSDSALVDYKGTGTPYDATNERSESLDSYYRFRILNSKQFSVH